ncbi:cobalamin biosynthesis protein CbiL [Tropicimonas sp. TH_r6]|uniref:cobalamin biosynthesis protein CbiL n=1 Tax=Tropicimonas sp. TH_r6 TaxID=3082085 RepID=UPI0029557DB8|nr:cobalamin biosynthesis protein CbiL [Tropicimonas sp. TH_r6]MDV7145763.1 cobalamin biosynthesis protein CbiL [Tropicimonas sp. TH_r6]
MKHLPALLIACLCMAGPSAAHSLRVFATVEAGQVVGYGFFVGGGRPQHAAWTASLSGHAVADGTTDAEGAFSFAAPSPVDAPLTVTINSGEGHVASRDLGPDRFGAAEGATVTAHRAAIATPPDDSTPEPSDISPDMIRAAVAREIAPLLERIEQMDARMRLTDILSGLCLIFGIAGIALWARGRRS